MTALVEKQPATKRKYQTVLLPIKKTSSEYYARLRQCKEEPEKYCAYCGARLHRKYSSGNGRWEDWSHFLNRKCCDNTCAQKLRFNGRKEDRQKAIPFGYKACKQMDGLYVNRDGEFIFNGKKKAVAKHIDRYGRKHTAIIKFLHNGETKCFAASRLVASAFMRKYDDDLYIMYKDDDIHNICVDNIILVSKKDYDTIRCEHAAEFRKTSTYDYQVQRLKVSIESNEAVLHYFQTGDFDKINKHVQKYLYNCLCEFCLKSLHFGMEQAPMMAADAIARWYEVILQGHAVGHGERYCKKILVNYKHKGWYGLEGKVPKNKIELIINNLNLECLWERFKVTKLKK